MKIADINPHIRFAQEVTYVSKDRCFHVKDCRIFYIIGGDGCIQIQDKTLPLKENNLFYCCGGQFYTINAEKHLRFYSLNFDLSQRQRKHTTPFSPEDIKKTTPTAPIDPCDITDSDFLNSFYLLENAVEFKNAIASIVTQYAAQRLYYRESCSTELKRLLIELHERNAASENSSADALQRILEYLHLHYKKDIKNSMLAEIAGYHEYYLNRLFVQNMGMSMHKYILNLRINEAKRLLLNTGLSIADIAFEVGFNSAAHFSDYFKQETAVSPMVFRSNFKHKI